jgi:acyl dehydratase
VAGTPLRGHRSAPQLAGIQRTPAGNFPVVTDRWFQDYVQGTTSQYGPIRVDEADVVDFGRRFDPQPFHVDAEAAAAGPFGGLIASGWHTCALMMRLLADEYLSPASSLGSPGVDELRWIQPVRPSDELTLRTTVEEARLSRSKPDRGLVRTRVELVNQDGAIVLSLRAMNLVRTRPETE